MAKTHLRLQHSESVIVQSTAQIYAAYIAAGRVVDGTQDVWIARSLEEAIRIALAADAAVISDDEIDATEAETGITMGRTRPSSRHQ